MKTRTIKYGNEYLKLHENGKQRVHIQDYNHGTRRVWMSPGHVVF